MDYTREYLAWVNENGKHLPDGPAILSPNGMYTSLARELTNTAHNFKINALKEILGLFPSNFYPFCAGFGNKKGDAIAYATIGLAKNQVFIISKSKKNDDFFKAIKHFDEIIDLDEKFPVTDDYIIL